MLPFMAAMVLLAARIWQAASPASRTQERVRMPPELRPLA
jgi:hypothetical protein